MNIQTSVMTLNLPVSYARIRPIVLVGEYFARPNLFTAQNNSRPNDPTVEPSLNKQVQSFIAKLFPSRITQSI